MLFANEEFGLSGAKEYARLVGDEAARHVLALEADLGAGAVWRIQSQVAPEAVPAVDAMREVLKPLALEAGDNTARGGSDLGPLRALGVPILDLSQDATQLLRRPPHDQRHARADRRQDAGPGRRGLRRGRVPGGEQERRFR